MTRADDAGEGRSRVVEAPPEAGDGCTLTQGFWKNHEEDWPVDELTIGGATYDKQELLDLFDTPPKGDKSMILAHQLMAAMLNVASGASSSAIADTLEGAQDWMAEHKDGDGRLPYGVSASEEAVALSGALADFNEGKEGPGHCDDGPPGGSGDPGGSSGSGDPGGGSTGGGDCPDDSGDPGGGDPGDSGSTGSGDPGGGDPGDSGSTGSGDPGGGDPPGGTCETPCLGDSAGACPSGSFCNNGCCTPVPR
jgi:hypothetical protein